MVVFYQIRKNAQKLGFFVIKCNGQVIARVLNILKVSKAMITAAACQRDNVAA